MLPTQQGSIRLFRIAGINIFLHWSWFVVAIFEINNRGNSYSSVAWNIAEYLALFLIVLLHELGHALACRSVGGKADEIVLWPLGGVAYVSPPQRPGATLWSIAAGPLVNVILFPVFLLADWFVEHSDALGGNPNIASFFTTLYYINLALFIFNMLPIYPLDGGQIVRSVLWFIFGRATSLMIAVVIGFVGVGLLIVGALLMHHVWLIIMSVFILLNCWRGLMHARALAKIAKIPRRNGFFCPSCHSSPPLGEFWQCPRCKQPFDMFLTSAICPHCQAQFTNIGCVDCGEARPLAEWSSPPKL